MKSSFPLSLFTSLVALALASSSTAAGPEVNESAREIPVAYDVDVVVVGGSTGAVSAAVTAAEAGQRVFLAAERPYLGDDMTASLRLWLDEGAKPTDPLAKAIFDDDHSANQPDPRRLPFTYQADMESSPPHEDKSPPTVLTDGIWGDPVRQTVQYNGDAGITADLQTVKQVEGVRLVVHHGAGPNPYKVAQVTVQTSNDLKTWTKATVIKIDNWGVSGNCLETTAPMQAKARYLRFAFERTSDAKRILIGEIEIIGPSTPETEKLLAGHPIPRPMHVKRVLDEALLAAGVDFLYGCYATDMLHDARGNPCGIVMANRAGRQAVVAKTIIDATDRASVARRAGADFRPFPTGRHSVRRVVIGGEIRQGPNTDRAK